MRAVHFAPFLHQAMLAGKACLQVQAVSGVQQNIWESQYSAVRQALLEQACPAQALNERVTAELQDTITSSPGSFTCSSERVQVQPILR